MNVSVLGPLTSMLRGPDKRKKDVLVQGCSSSRWSLPKRCQSFSRTQDSPRSNRIRLEGEQECLRVMRDGEGNRISPVNRDIVTVFKSKVDSTCERLLPFLLTLSPIRSFWVAVSGGAD